MPELVEDRNGQRYYRDEQGNLVPVSGTASGMARSALQGATLGFSDELRGFAAGIRGLFSSDQTAGEAYAEARDKERRALERFRTAQPGAAIASEIVGGFASGGLGAARAGAFRGVQTLGQALRRGAAVGAAEGGVAGFGGASGGVADRALGATTGAAIGGVAGAAVPAAQGAFRALRPSAESTLRGVAQNMPEQEVRQRLASLGPEGTLADVNESLQTIADASTARITADQSLIDALGDRASRKFGRISAAARGTMGGIDERAETLAELVNVRRTQASPLYEQALEQAPAPPVRLERLLDDPDVSKIWKRVKTSGRRQQLMAEMGGDAVALTEDEISRAQPSMRGWHFIQSRLGDEIRRLQRTSEVDATTVRELTQLRNTILQDLDQLPGYAQARQLYGSAKGAEEAVGVGEKLLNMPLSQARATLETMTDADLAFARVGLGSSIEDAVSRGLKEGQVPRTLRSEAFDQKMQLLFRNDQAGAQRFAETIDNELAMQGTFARLQGGSQTAQRQATQQQISGFNPFRAIRGAISGDVGDVMIGPGQRALNELTQYTLSTDPAVQARALALMYSPQVLPVNRTAMIGALGLGAGVAPQFASQGALMMGGE